MLSDLGNVEGAEAAYKRAVAGGSQMAVFNLGLLLAMSGRRDEAKQCLLRLWRTVILKRPPLWGR
ncbi:MAG: hypothetical protein M3Y33_09510 [Actinomycetota bacterium]|nr:hypothetical protein [Actinomycetota bacterium]